MELHTILELLRQKTNVTEYEKKNNIYCTGIECLAEYDDIHFYFINKSDNTDTLTIVYRTGINSKLWLMWRVTEKQAEILMKTFPTLYNKINKDNQEKRIPVTEPLQLDNWM